MSNTETSGTSFPHRLKKVFSVSPNDRTESDLAELMHVTSDIDYLKKLTEERGSDRVHWECCRVMTLEVFQKDQNVITFGEVGEKFYIILQGKVSILLPVKVKKPVKVQKIQNFFEEKYSDTDGKLIPPELMYIFHLDLGFRVAVRGSGTRAVSWTKAK